MIRLQAVRFTLAWSALMATMVCLAAADLGSGAPLKQAARPAATRQAQPPLDVFVAVIGDDEKRALAALAQIEQNWHESSTAMLIEMIHFVPNRRVLGALIALVEKKSGWDNVASARDSLGNAWRVDESQLTAANGQTLKRLPAHRAFWFGWHAAFPDTRLVKPRGKDPRAAPGRDEPMGPVAARLWQFLEHVGIESAVDAGPKGRQRRKK